MARTAAGDGVCWSSGGARPLSGVRGVLGRGSGGGTNGLFCQQDVLELEVSVVNA